MTSRRLVLVTRRFWPLADDGAQMLARLAVELKTRGHRPTIVTAQSSLRWPSELLFEDVPVVRIGPAPTQLWNSWRYLRKLSAWLRGQAREIDLIYAGNLKHEALAALAASAAGLPVVLRAEGGPHGDCRWQEQTRLGHLFRRRCQKSSCVIVSDDATADELQHAGYDPRATHVIADGVAVPKTNDAERMAIRRAFSQVHSDMRLGERTPLAVYVGPLEADTGLSDLVAAWARIRRQRPDARLWLVGEGRARPELFNQIERLSLGGHVLLPGVVEAPEDLLIAADLFLWPLHQPRPSLPLLQAMAAAVTPIVSDLPSHRRLLTSNEHGLTFPAGDVEALVASVMRLLCEPALSTALAAAARRRVEQEFPLDRCTTEHLELFEAQIAGGLG